MDKILVKSKYNTKLHQGFYKFHLFKKSTSTYFLVIAVVLTLFMAITNTLNKQTPLESKITSWVLTLMVIVFLPFFAIGRIRGVIRRNKKERGETIEVIEISKAKILRFIEGQEKVVLGWEQFESVYELEDCFYMYIDKDRGLVIAKDDIVEGSIDIFRKLVNNNLRPDKKGKVKFKKMYKDDNK